MFKTLDRLRKKPDAVRRKYAFGISLGLVAVIGGFWLNAFVSNLSSSSQSATVESSAPSPLNAVSQNISEGYQSVKDNIANSNPFTNPAAATSSASDQVIITDSPVSR